MSQSVYNEGADNNAGIVSELVEMGLLPTEYVQAYARDVAGRVDGYFDDDNAGMGGSSGGGGAGASFGSPEPFDGYGAMDSDDLVVSVNYAGAPDVPVNREQAIVAIIKTVMSNPDIIKRIRDYTGTIMRPAPTMQGQPITGPMLPILLSQLDKDARRAVVQYAAGMPAPIGLSKNAQKYFVAFMIVDGIQSTGASIQGLFDPDDY